MNQSNKAMLILFFYKYTCLGYYVAFFSFAVCYFILDFSEMRDKQFMFSSTLL